MAARPATSSSTTTAFFREEEAGSPAVRQGAAYHRSAGGGSIRRVASQCAYKGIHRGGAVVGGESAIAGYGRALGVGDAAAPRCRC